MNNTKFETALEAARQWIADPRNARSREAIPLRKFLAAVDRGEMAQDGDTVAVPFAMPASPGRFGQAVDWRNAWQSPSIRWDLDRVIERLAREQSLANLTYKA